MKTFQGIALALIMLVSLQAEAKFLTPDPVKPNPESGQNFNRYWYADNNPVKNTDPDGLESACFATGVGCGLTPITPEIQAKQEVAMTAMAGAVVAVGLVGPAVAAAVTEVSQFGVVGAILANPSTVTVGAVTAVDAVAVVSTGGGMPSTLALGPYAAASIEARSTAQTFTSAERAAVNKIGAATGCHTCGTTTAGTKSGNFVPDHQPVSSLNQSNAPQKLYPQCLSCSRQQGLDAAKRLREEMKP